MMDGNYFWRVGEVLDQFLNVTVLDGQLGESISEHAAVDAAAGKWWACILCKYLAVTVDPTHCQDTLAGKQTSNIDGLKAGIQLLALFLALTGLFWWAVLR
jgi:hypothetical protein